MKKYLLAAVLLSSSAYASFEEPSCLKKNVDLWTRIYTEIDADTALVLDVETMEILEVLHNFPEEQKPRRSTAGKVKKRYEKDGIKVRVLTGIKTRFNEGIDRFIKYKPLVIKELRKQNLPIEIAALPHVESSYNPAARSKVGAVGMWQVMPATARLLGFNPKRLPDPGYNTMVGVAVLSNNYESLQSWPLAITAYNHGLNGVQKAVRSTGSSDICTIMSNYQGPRFGLSSKNFYASFLAVLRVLRERGLLSE
jgi:membrane-bound lytic murein transglycosylase D